MLDSLEYAHHPSQHETSLGKLLALVARGNAILAELFKLADLVPEPFKLAETGARLDRERRSLYEKLTHHFGYFKEADSFESRIEASRVLKEADERLYDNHFNGVQRFYMVFESIQRFADELNKLVPELEEEAGQSLASLVQDTHTCQLLCEAYFLLGLALLTTDNQFEGTLRERLLVSYYRYSALKTSRSSLLDSTCNLVRTTGFRCPEQDALTLADPTYHRPPRYPECLLERLDVNQSVVELLVSKLLTVDIYNQTLCAFPHPEHRSTALGQQASIIYVLLYFSPSILNNEKLLMREITNRFFYDNWVLSVYMGDLVNLLDAWQPYPAAREALAQMFESGSCFDGLAQRYRSKYDLIRTKFDDYLKEGWLDKTTVLQHHVKLLDCIKDANIVLRWFLLHSQASMHRTGKLAHSMVLKSLPTGAELYTFLQSLADLEKNFSAIYNLLLLERATKIIELRDESELLLDELIGIFNDSKPVLWVQTGANSRLSQALSELKLFLERIQVDGSEARDSFFKVIKRMDEYKDTYTDGRSLQVAQLFSVAKDNIGQIVRLLALKDGMDSILHSVGDLSYAWKIFDSIFTDQMQQLIRSDPLKVQRIESTFRKLLPASNKHLIRLRQANFLSELNNVSLYYSSKLVNYMRHVLQVFPETIIQLVTRIGEIQRHCTELSWRQESMSKISLEGLRDSACPERRLEIQRLTYKVSQYAESMLIMEDTETSSMQLNSRQLLEDGIREEISKKISETVQATLGPISQQHTRESKDTSTSQAQEFLDRLNLLDANLSVYLESLEYIQEYLSIHGLKVWYEEMDRFIKSAIVQVQEALVLMDSRDQVRSHDLRSMPQTSQFTQLLLNGSTEIKSNFILKLLDDLMHLTNPRTTIYDEQMNTWYLQEPSRQRMVNLKAFETLASSLGSSGLCALDEICSMMAKKEIESLSHLLESITSKRSKQSQSLMDALSQLNGLEQDIVSGNQRANRQSSSRLYASILAKVSLINDRLVNHLLYIGQIQALRMNISYTLSMKSRYEAPSVYNCLETLNNCLLVGVQDDKELLSQQEEGSCEEDSLDTNEDLGSFQSGNSEQETCRQQCNNPVLIEEKVAALDDNYGCEMEHINLVHAFSSFFERVGLSDPISRLYSLALANEEGYSSCAKLGDRLVAEDLSFLILLDQCSRFKFSLAMSGFIPKEPKSFYETAPNVDAQPFFYGLITLMNHLQPSIPVGPTPQRASPSSGPASCLLKLLKSACLYVSVMLNDQTDSISSARAQNLTLEVANMILSMIELVRLSKQPPVHLLTASHLPKFVLDTFQFIVCHLSPRARANE